MGQEVPGGGRPRGDREHRRSDRRSPPGRPRLSRTPIELPSTTWGTGTRRVLLLHGLGSAGPVWWKVGRDLADAGYSVCAPDLRGHGGSEHPGDYRVEAYADDVLASCPGPWELVVGHSLGGTVAVVIADRTADFARSLLLVDPAIEFAPVQRREARERLAGEAEQPPSVDELLAANPRWAPEDAHLKRSAVLATEPDVMRDSIDHNDPWLFGDLLAGLDVPIHVLGADPDHDALFGADLYRRLRAAKPDLTFEVVDGAGHSVFRDDPDAVVGAAVATLEQVPHR